MADYVDALVDAVDAAAADDAVGLDGFRVERDGDGYRLSTPDSSRAGLAESDLRAALRTDYADYAADWYFWTDVVGGPSTDRGAFLRWLEGADDADARERYDALADGVSRSWGQLRLTVELDGDTDRVYEVRHVDDAGVPAAELDAYREPLAARQLATYDERGRYRPLKTGANLAGGWVFPALDARDVVETVEAFYPASVPNWARERRGELDVTHWSETADRQTGIYGIVSELPREAVEWVAEATCVDSQCVKRREWQYAADDGLDADGGDGAFPCREPCSLVVAAARTWTKLEREETRTYEFELTPSEKEQLEAIVDAVADDRLDDVREADVDEGANRYRTRYLRAKLFDDDGNLCGVPTDADE